MRLITALGLLAMMIGWPAAGVAQEPQKGNQVSFGIGGGRTAPMSDTRDILKDGFNGQGFIRLELGEAPLAIRAGISYQNFDLLRELTIDGVTDGGTQTLLGGLAELQVFLPGKSVRGYLLASGGFYNLKTELEGEGAPIQIVTRLAAGAGAGLEAGFDGLRVYLEGRIDHVFTNEGDLLGEGVKFAPVSIGVMF